MQYELNTNIFLIRNYKIYNLFVSHQLVVRFPNAAEAGNNAANNGSEKAVGEDSRDARPSEEVSVQHHLKHLHKPGVVTRAYRLYCTMHYFHY